MIEKRNAFGIAVSKYNEEMFIKCFKNAEPYTRREIEMEIKCSRDSVKKYLAILEGKGLIKSKCTDIGWVYWKV